MQNAKYLFIIIALAWAAYSNSFYTPMHYDDSVNIIRNENIHTKEITLGSLEKMMFAGGAKGDIYHPTLYRPLSMMSFAFNYYFHKLDVFGYHVVNFTIHVIASIFLFLFVRLWLRDREDNTVVALLAAVFWSVNPVNLTSVTYIVQRMSEMAGMFYIMAMYFYLKGRVSNWKYYMISIACAICAVGSKENAVMVFPVIFLFDLMFFRHGKKFWYLTAGVLLIMTILTLAMSGPETFSIEKLQAGYAKRDFTLTERLLTEPRVILFYIMLLVFPIHNLLSITHTVPISHGLTDPWETSLAIFIILIFIFTSISIKRKHPVISFCILFYFANHIIEGSIFPLELVYEHRNYTPAMLFFVPIAIGIVGMKRNYLKIGFVVCMVSFLSYNTYYQNEIWKTDFDLWEDTIKKSPDPRSMFNMAGAYYCIHDGDNAMKYWDISARFNEIYGTNYNEDPDCLPYGRVMQMAHHNSKMLWMEKNGRIRRAWKTKRDINEIAVIRSEDG